LVAIDLSWLDGEGVPLTAMAQREIRVGSAEIMRDRFTLNRCRSQSVIGWRAEKKNQ